jgi:hypothetical protein
MPSVALAFIAGLLVLWIPYASYSSNERTLATAVAILATAVIWSHKGK